MDVTDIDEAQRQAIIERVKRVDAAGPDVRAAVRVLGPLVPQLPATEDLLLSVQSLDAWRVLRDDAADIFLIYFAQVRRKCGGAVAELVMQQIGPRRGLVRKLELLTPSDMVALKIGADLVEGMIPTQGIVSLIGVPGSAKSAFLDHLCNSLGADMAPIAGRLFTACASLVIAPEGNRMARLRAWCDHHCVEAGKIRVRYVQQGVDLRAPRGDIDQILELIDIAESDLGPLGIVAIDTLNRAFGGGSENEAGDMGEFLTNLQRITERTQGAVILAHHLGKDATKGARGHGSLLGAVDAEIIITRDGDIRTATVTKSRDGAEGAQLAFKLKVIDLGPHPDQHYRDNGRRLDSIVVDPLPDQPFASKANSARIPAGARVALDALKSAIARHGEYPAGASMVDRNQYVSGDVWRAAYDEMRPIADDETDARKVKQARRMAFNRAQDQLQAARLVGTNAGNWWVL